ncbi:hypothetical protein GBA52_018892 [Prunus armeniaca]|nr:hypothetical protein GBA52_018892 [Prunus armeniaca]
MERVTATVGRGRHQSLLRFNGLKIIFGSRTSYASMLGHGGHAQHQSIPCSWDPLRVARTRKTYKLDRSFDLRIA